MSSLLLTILSLALLCLLCSSQTITLATVDSFVACLERMGIANFTTADSSSYTPILDFSIQNLRFTETGVPKPAAIVLPSSVQEVQSSWACVRATGFALRVRSGGHSYEGLSSTASAPFVIIDFMNLNAITVNVTQKSVWVQSGARLGEVYYAVATASSSTLGVSAGTCSTIGLSGHIMGGGYGMLSRKYGTAADNLLEAQVITANGTLIESVSTADPDLFWALRGGGGGAWGIVVAWKLKLVDVPAVVTTFKFWRIGKQVVTDLAYKWQSVAPAAPPELFAAIYFEGVNSSGVADIGASFYGQYWGTIDQTIALFSSLFPELGLTASDCKQGNWLQAAAVIALVSDPSALLNRQQTSRNFFKAKSDYVLTALTKQALAGAFDIIMQNTRGWMIFEPYGGVMSQISSDAIAFPYRVGNLYVIQYQAVWADDTTALDNALTIWLRMLYNHMAPFVTYTPSRSSFVNYIDPDLGDSVSAGKSYFGSNFAKLVTIKARIDPSNLFNQPQSVPISMESCCFFPVVT